jgi:hypothetical protein
VFNGDGVGGARIDKGAFELIPNDVVHALFGDYNRNGTVDAADYIVWRKTLGTNVSPPFTGADGDGDGVIDADDHGVWRAHFGQTVPPPGAGSGAAISSLSESASQPGEFAVAASANSAPAEANDAAVPSARFDVLDMPSRRQESASRSRRAINQDHWSESLSDDLLMLAIDRIRRCRQPDTLESDTGGKNDRRADNDDDGPETEEPLDVSLAEWH